MCIIENQPHIHLGRKSTEVFITKFGRFCPLFSQCEHMVFEGWCCVKCSSQQIEEKVINFFKSELYCPNCRTKDEYIYREVVGTKARTEFGLPINAFDVEYHLDDAFGDLDAVCFK